MKSCCLLFVLLLLCSLSFPSFGQGPKIQWAKCYGGGASDEAFGVQQTFDGGYITVGKSFSIDGNVTDHKNGTSYSDVWVVKTDISGNIAWAHSFGSGIDDGAFAVQQTKDGGYIIAGYTTYDGDDVSGYHSGMYMDAPDAWILKLNAHGMRVWQKCLGGTGNDYATAIHQTADGGYIVAGVTNSMDGDVTSLHKDTLGNATEDMWVVKLDDTGAIQWQKVLGGSDQDGANCVIQTKDGGYLLGGYTTSEDGDITKHYVANDYDAWAVKLDSKGKMQWQSDLGGTNEDEFNAVLQDKDGSYIFTGSTNSNDNDVSGNHQNTVGPTQDLWVVKVDLNGTLLWQRCLGGSFEESGEDIQQTFDSCYIIAGYTTSADGDITRMHARGGSSYDEWLLRLDHNGDLVWQKCIGGTGSDLAYAVKLTYDGGCILAGGTGSDDGDVTGIHGGGDFWLVKLGGPLTVANINDFPDVISSFPNPFQATFILQYHLSTEASVEVTDAAGKVITTIPLPKNTTQTTINAATWQPGIYFYKVLQNGNTLQTGKLLKQ